MSNHHAVVKTQAELAEMFAQDLTTGVGRSVKHDSAAKHVSGESDGTPFSAAFIPEVPEASYGRSGVFSHTSTPCVSCAPRPQS